MAKFKISDNSLRKFSDAIVSYIEDKLTGPSARSKLTRTVQPFMEEKISEAIAGKDSIGNTVTCKAFRPDSVGGLDLIGQLGIGDGNGTLPEKYTKGWQALLPGTNAASVKVSFARKSFGSVTYTLDKEKFYNAEVNKYIAHSKGDSREVPWMRYFIEGEVAEGYDYREGDFAFSRTGLGVMMKIPSKIWRIEPQPDPYARIIKAIKLQIGRKTFKDELKQLIIETINA